MNVDLASLVHGTPAWVFVLFAYLLWAGLKRLTPSVGKTSRVWITPIIFIAWGAIGLLERSGPSAHSALTGSLLHWLTAAALGAGLGGLSEVPLQVDRRRNLVLQPGSALPLVRNMLIFGAHYVLHVLAVMQPQMSARFMDWDVYVSGAAAGYFLGWAIRFVRSHRRAAHIELDARAPLAPGVSR